MYLMTNDRGETMAVVTSKDNRLVKQWRALCRDAHARREGRRSALGAQRGERP